MGVTVQFSQVLCDGLREVVLTNLCYEADLANDPSQIETGEIQFTTANDLLPCKG